MEQHEVYLIEAVNAEQKLLASDPLGACLHSPAAVTTGTAVVNWQQQGQACSLHTYNETVKLVMQVIQCCVGPTKIAAYMIPLKMITSTSRLLTASVLSA